MGSTFLLLLREFLFGVARVLGDFSPRMRYDLLERSIVRAKATRSVSLLKLKARCAFNASSVASAPRPRERSFGRFILKRFLTIRSRFITLACETRVGSPLDFQLKRVSALKCLRALRFKRSGKSMRPVLF